MCPPAVYMKFFGMVGLVNEWIDGSLDGSVDVAGYGWMDGWMHG